MLASLAYRLLLLAVLPRATHLDIAEVRGCGTVAGPHHLLGLALAAVRCSPQSPLIARADGVHRIPEFGGDAGVRRILDHASEPATFDLPRDLAAVLKVVALIVDRP